jgi:hypothetical protein
MHFVFTSEAGYVTLKTCCLLALPGQPLVQVNFGLLNSFEKKVL